MNLEFLEELSNCRQSNETSSVFTPEKLHELNEAGFIIGGSLALRLQGFIINRPINEVDLTINEKQYLEKEVVKYFGETKEGQFPSDHSDSKYCFEGSNNELYDILVWKGNLEYNAIIIDGFELKLQSPDQIWFKKKEYNFKGYHKHGFDLNLNKIETTPEEIKIFSEMIGVMNNSMTSIEIDDLPF